MAQGVAFGNVSEAQMTRYRDGRPEWNENEINIAEFYRNQGRKQAKEEILTIIQAATKKSSAVLVKIIERIESAID